MKRKTQLLLLEDVESLGRSGDVVEIKRAGYARNYLLPRKKGVVASNATLKLQASLKEARQQQALMDRSASEEMAKRLEGYVLSTTVKVDPEGNMYGSVAAFDVARMMQEKGFALDKGNVHLPKAIRSVGVHTVTLKLKEGVPAVITLEVVPEGGFLPPPPSKTAQE